MTKEDKHNIESINPLSPMQQGMLFHTLLAPKSGVYFNQVLYTVTGSLHEPAFQHAWQQIVDRHEPLRTLFVWEGQEKPLQVVRRQVALPWEGLDWRGLSADRQTTRLEEFLKADRQRGLDVSQAPLMRVTLIRMEDSRYELIWSLHHIVIDGWSSSLLLKEVMAAYQALTGAQDCRLEAVRPYREFINWLQGQDYSKAEQFWRGELKGFTTPTPLVSNRVDTAHGDRGLDVAQQLERSPSSLMSALRSFGRQHGLTLSTLIHGGWAVLLSRYSGEKDVVFGSTVSGRPAEILGVESMVGLFINTLPVRARFSRQDTVLSWLKDFQNRLLELRQYEHTSLVEVQGWSDVPRGQPLFESLLVFENYPMDTSVWDKEGALTVSNMRVVGPTNFPLSLVVVPGTELTLNFRYDLDRFDTSAIKRMSGHFNTLMEGIVSNPGQRLSELPLLTDAERQQLLVEWNRTKVAYPEDRCLHELIEEQVERTPEAEAVVFEDQRLTYRQLDERANQLAHYLRSLGVRPEQLVGVCMERSLEMVVALYGILKAGGAYVPIDPEYPSDRVAFMVEDAGVSVLLTQSRLATRLAPNKANIVCLDIALDTVAAHPSDKLESAATCHNLAYIIYTSGSTGQPKGVAMEHQTLINLISWQCASPSFSRNLRTLQFAALGFDVSFQEILSTWYSGGTLFLISEEIRRDFVALLHFLINYSVERLFLPFVALQHLAETALDQRLLPLSLQEIITAGEQLQVTPQIRGFFGELTDCVLQNQYGPSETHVVTVFTLSGPSTRWPKLPPIGRPIANAQVLVLDADRQLVPIGVHGELYIGGVCLARGYLNRPELTRERFIPSPFCADADARLYKSGDLVRRLPDGNVEFLGRMDQQVKIRGFRIELGEIESVLAGHPGVREAVVVAREDQPGDKRLVAYVVGRDGTVPTSEVRALLQSKLPDYMVPSAFVFLEALPLTPNGKLDRQALPAPDGARPELEHEYLAPRTPTEQSLAKIWADILGLERVSVHDNFFELGGHSLLATRVVSRIRNDLKMELPLRMLFQGPTVAQLAQLVDMESHPPSEQTLTDPKPISAASADPIPRRTREGELPLSFAQQRLWFIDQFEADSPTYNIPLALRLTGPLNSALLKRCLSEIVRRHEVLRTTFLTEAGRPVQRIEAAASIVLPLRDLSGLGALVRDGEVRRHLADEARRPFDLSHDLMLRAGLLRLAAQEHIFYLTLHHSAADGWSLEILLRELSTLYLAFSSDRPSPLTDLPIQYADYAAWQREWLQGEVLEEQVAYWKGQLEGAPPLLELPTDHPRPAMKTYRGAAERFLLDKEITKKFEQLSRQEGVTLFMTLLAAFQTLLSRYTGQEDIVVGTPIAGRNRIETEELIGFFVNTLAIRTDLSGNPTFKELLGRIREVTLAAYSHQDLPFEKLVEDLNPERNLSYAPLIQVMFSLQHVPTTTFSLPGAIVSSVDVDTETAKFDLSLGLAADGDELRGALAYNSDLFERSTIQRILEHFQVLLESISSNPQQRIAVLALLTERERHQLLVEWNDTQTEYPQDRCLHELFEQQVERTPEAVAVVFGDTQLTYRQLNERANQLARHLKKLGVSPDQLVGVCMERSLEMVVGLLGILKAGGAYVPLDPECPKDRLAFMMEDAALRVLLTQARLTESLPPHRVQIVRLDADWPLISIESAADGRSQAQSDHLAYVIYTSGSTGLPKGCKITHHNVVRLLRATEACFQFNAGDVWTLFHTYAFDFSVWELWGALLYGGRLVVVPYEVSRSPDAFYQLLVQQKVTVLNQTPSAFRQLIWAEDLATEQKPLHLRYVIFGGEALDVQMLKPWWDRHGDASPQLINMYGITETTVHVTYRPLTRADLDRPTSPIGRPIHDLAIYLLDEHRQPVPIGVPGEIYVGGAGVARGYWNRPELTAERFISNPFRDDLCSRIYKSGDLARYLPDGSLEYLGRADNQVKIRGFRIELGEIEVVISGHPSIREAVVVAREDQPGDKRLVAYVVGRDGTVPTSEVRALLQSKLPDYMVPSAFVFLEALPLTPNGKLDRQALPAPDGARPELEHEYLAPRTPTEQALAKIWADILGLERVSVHDNFFELGGHSLLATRVVSRIRNDLKMELPLRMLFQGPTVAQLAQLVDMESHPPSEQTLTDPKPISAASADPIPRRTREGELPLSFAQQRLWFIDQFEADSPTYNIPLALRLTGPLNSALLKRCLSEIVRRHEVLRTTFLTEAGRPVQRIEAAASIVLPLRDLSGLGASVRDGEVRRHLADEARRPFDLSHDLMLRAGLLRLAAQEHIFYLTLHHSAADGWSLEILLRELSTLYLAFSSDRPSPLTDLPIQYADYAAWQREWLQGEVLEEQVAYWKGQLEGAPPLLELPTDHPRPAMKTYRGAAERFLLDKEITKKFEQLSRQEGVTLFMTLLAAFQTLLSRYTGQEDIVVGTPIAGRNRIETEELIGFFVNTLAIRTDLSGNPTFKELLGRIREVTLAAYSHQDLPFEKLVEDLNPERNLSYAPLIQVMFSLQHVPTTTFSLPGAIVSSVDVDTETAKFDLSLGLAADGDELRGALAYNSDLFERSTIQRILEHFQVLLESIVSNPQQRIAVLALLTERERHQLLVEWNDTQTEYPQDRCLHELFEQQVERTPEAVAVVFEDQRLTYRQLNARANQLAHYLRSLGVRPEQLVGVCMERSLEMVVGLLGILKAGGAYVPIDPEYPADRVAFMLEDANVSVLLTQSRLAGKLPPHQAKVVCLDSGWEEIAREGEAKPTNLVSASNLAYMIYTSGSTGRPKGAMNTHRGICNRLLWAQAQYNLTSTDAVLQKTPFSFDVSVWEFFWPLLAGARLVVARPGGHKDAAYLARVIEEQQITVIHFVPPMLRVFLEDADAGQCGSLRHVMCSGEALEFDLQELFFQRVRAQLHNLYGPTEAAVEVTHWTCQRNSSLGVVPIGRPVANTQTYILDRCLQPVPIGVPGELHLGGVQVGRGYHNRPELTAEKFIPDPFSAEAEARLYKTGDLARYLPDGAIEYLGRLDHQVKIRGFRIELGEIESVLAGHPGVREAVAVAREDVPGEKRLVAYLTRTAEELPSVPELRDLLQAKLPDYMVPSAFVTLERFPLTPNGKVDRKALPIPEIIAGQAASGYVAPRTPVELALSRIWTEVLGVERIGIHDNFFELGGHSLMASRVVSRIHNSLRVNVTLQRFFQGPTVAQLEQFVDVANSPSDSAESLSGKSYLVV